MKQKILMAFSLLVGGMSVAQSVGDLNSMPQGFVLNHDSTTCSSAVSGNLFIDKQNSFLNDSIKIIDFGGQVVQTFVNTSGSSFWTGNIYTYPPDMVSDIDIDPTTSYLNYGLFGWVYKIISGPDTIYNVQEPFVSEYIPDPCSYETVSGKIYIDNDNDCSFGSGDVGVGSYNTAVSVNVTNSPTFLPYANTYTNSNGDYTAKIQSSYFTDMTIGVNPNYQFIFPNNGCAPYSNYINSLPQTGVDFVLQCADIDVRVSAPHSTARPTVPFYMSPLVTNFGCDSVSGTLNFVLDPNVTYNAANSSNPADVVSGDTLKWFYTDITNVSNGAYWQTFVGGIELTPNASLNAGDVITFKVFTDVPANDIDATNNTQNISITLVNSFDPNFKEVTPKGVGTPGFISANNEKFTYTIHFQNTGNAPAINISVLDSLEANNIIPSSLRILNSSHTMSPEWVSNNVIKFNFNNINLPDSTSNEPQSHGFVTFEIDMEQNLAELTEIKNKAYIYFDNNAPIITNNTINTIEALNLEEVQGNEMSVIVYPNPSSDFATISVSDFNDQTNLTLQLIDVSGKLVLTNKFSTDKITINTSVLESGVYIYSIWNETTKQFVNGKLIVE